MLKNRLFFNRWPRLRVGTCATSNVVHQHLQGKGLSLITSLPSIVVLYNKMCKCAQHYYILYCIELKLELSHYLGTGWASTKSRLRLARVRPLNWAITHCVQGFLDNRKIGDFDAFDHQTFQPRKYQWQSSVVFVVYKKLHNVTVTVLLFLKSIDTICANRLQIASQYCDNIPAQ